MRALIKWFSRTWNRLPLRAKGALLAALPMLAIIISAASAFIGNKQREAIEYDVQRKFAMVSKLNEMLTLMVNAETGVRGFVLTRREEFLEPYTMASEQLPANLARLRGLAEAEPGAKPRAEKLARLNTMQQLIERDLSALARLRLSAVAPDNSESDMYEQLAQSKALMDSLRGNLDAMQTEEQKLLTVQLQKIHSVRQRDYLVITLALIVGLAGRFLAFYLFNRSVVARVSNLRENVQHIRQGTTLPHPPSGKKDALGELENAIAIANGELHRRLDGLQAKAFAHKRSASHPTKL